MFTRKLNRIIFSVGMISFCFTISGCATGPYVAAPPPTIEINTIPNGADISIQGNYIGVSPVAIPMPSVMLENEYRRWTEVGRADQPLQIQAQLKGYETKDVSFGVFHAPKERVIQPVFSYSAIIKTTPGYYTFPDRITIKLAPLVGKLNEDSIPIKQGVIYQPEYKPSPPPVLTAKDALPCKAARLCLPMIIKGENLVLPRITAEAGDGSKVKSTLKAGNSAKGRFTTGPA